VTDLVIALAALVLVLVLAVALRSRKPRALRVPRNGRRILVPFTGGELDPDVLNAAIRVAHAEPAVLVPAYLLVVPLEYSEDTPLSKEVSVAMPVLEAVEHAALRAGVPVDARIEKGRTPTHALRRLWEVEQFDRVIAPARAGEHSGFSPKDLTWILTHAPTETLVLRPSPENGEPSGRWPRKRQLVEHSREQTPETFDRRNAEALVG
jgi:xanthine/CO dehydrogenase XdhC/CoxF family maturation factor